MPKVIFTISYDINPEKRDDYLQVMQELKNHITASTAQNYSVFQQKENHFVEVYMFNSVEEFDRFEESEDEKTESLVNRVMAEFAMNGTKKYTKWIEVV
jgi:L-rhamnose mutarotase